jgi:hypothetical protein
MTSALDEAGRRGVAVYFDFSGEPAERAAALARLLYYDAARRLRWARFHALHSASYGAAFGGDAAAEWVSERLRLALRL